MSTQGGCHGFARRSVRYRALGRRAGALRRGSRVRVRVRARFPDQLAGDEPLPHGAHGKHDQGQGRRLRHQSRDAQSDRDREPARSAAGAERGPDHPRIGAGRQRGSAPGRAAVKTQGIRGGVDPDSPSGERRGGYVRSNATLGRGLVCPGGRDRDALARMGAAREYPALHCGLRAESAPLGRPGGRRRVSADCRSGDGGMAHRLRPAGRSRRGARSERNRHRRLHAVMGLRRFARCLRSGPPVSRPTWRTT